MKLLITLLASCLSLCAATTYPVISDNANRTLYGGTTNIASLNGTNTLTGTNNFTGTVIITNAASTISGNGAGLTNLAAGNIASGSLDDARLSANVGLLSATNQTWTGTNTFPAAKFYQQNGIRYRSLFLTNVWMPTITACSNGAGLYNTNNGDYQNSGGKVAICRVPALLTTNSALIFSLGEMRTNAHAAGMCLGAWVGPSTNMVVFATSFFGSQSTTPLYVPGINQANQLIVNYGSFTNQMAPSISLFNSAMTLTGFNAVDTSVPFDVYFGLSCNTAGTTNTNTLVMIRISEVIPDAP